MLARHVSNIFIPRLSLLGKMDPGKDPGKEKWIRNRLPPASVFNIENMTKKKTRKTVSNISRKETPPILIT